MTYTWEEGGFDDRFKAEEAKAKARPNGTASDVDDLICTHAEPHDITDIEPRRWAYGSFLLFGEASAIGAVDGGGKGAHAAAIGLSVITGHELLGEKVWRTGPVSVISYEDSEIEWRRRIAATCKEYDAYGIQYRDVIQHFHFIRLADRPVQFAVRDPETRGVTFPDGWKIVRQLKQIGAVGLIIDPFNHAHGLEDGNSNPLMARVASEVKRVAEAADVWVLVNHHLRKGSTGSTDDFMGATSLRATFRSVRILARMTADQGQKLGVPRKERFRFSRIADSKENYAPPPEYSTWYRLNSVFLENRAGIYVKGDNVQAVVVWTPPSPIEGVDLHRVRQIFDDIEAGPGDGKRYAERANATFWVGNIIQKHTSKTKDEAKMIIRRWIDDEVLVVEEEPGDSRHPLKTVRTNPEKVAELLGPLVSDEDDDDSYEGGE